LQALYNLEDAIAVKAAFVPVVTRDNFICYRNDLLGNVAFAQSDGFGLPYWHRLEQITVNA
jgi:hypothetical protein